MSDNMKDLDVEHLIELVSHYPQIWDRTVEKYHCRVATYEAWKLVCEQLDPGFEAMPSDEKFIFTKTILSKWRNIRDQWMKMEKKVDRKKKSGAKAKYIYHEQLSFLKKTLGNTTESCFSEDPELSVDSIEGSDSSAYVPSCTKTRSSTAAGKEVARKKAKLDTEKEIFTTIKEEAPDTLIYTYSEPWASTLQTTPEASTPSEKGSRKKAKKDLGREMLESSEESEDPNRLFYKSIRPWMTDFSGDELLQFHIGVLKLIKDIKRGRKSNEAVPSSSWQGPSTFQQGESLSQQFILPVQRVTESHLSSPEQKSSEDSE